MRNKIERTDSAQTQPKGFPCFLISTEYEGLIFYSDSIIEESDISLMTELKITNNENEKNQPNIFEQKNT